MSNGNGRLSGFERGAVTHHGVEDGQELAHAGDHHHFEGFSGVGETPGEALDLRIMGTRGQGGHVQTGAHGVSPAGDGAFAGHASGVVVEGGHADEGADLFAVQGAQFGGFGEKRGAGSGADVRDALEDLVLAGEVLVFVDEPGDFLVDLFDRVMEPSHEGVDVFLDEGVGRGFEAAAFLGAGLDELAAAEDQGVELFLDLGFGHDGLRVHGLGVERQEVGVDGVGLGFLSTGLGKRACLCGLDAADGEVVFQAGGDEGAVVGSGGFDDDALGVELLEQGDDGGDAWRGVVEGVNVGLVGGGQIEAVLADVDADMDGGS